MSKYDKLVTKLLNRESVIAYQELNYLLVIMGYKESTKGKTSGSRVAFYNEETKHIIRLHKPQPGNEFKDYVKRTILTELKNRKLI